MATEVRKRVWLANGSTPWSLHHDTAVLHKDYFLLHRNYKPNNRFQTTKWQVKNKQLWCYAFTTMPQQPLEWGGKKRQTSTQHAVQQNWILWVVLVHSGNGGKCWRTDSIKKNVENSLHKATKWKEINNHNVDYRLLH